jgi:hypothetical protein
MRPARVVGLLALFCSGLPAAGQDAGVAQPPSSPAAPSASTVDTPSTSVPAPDQSPTTEKQLTGTVVKVTRRTVYLEHLGPVIPLTLDANTKFESAGLTRAKDIKEGQKLRATFVVHNKIDNVALTVWLEGATSTKGFSGPIDLKQSNGRGTGGGRNN